MDNLSSSILCFGVVAIQIHFEIKLLTADQTERHERDGK